MSTDGISNASWHPPRRAPCLLLQKKVRCTSAFAAPSPGGDKSAALLCRVVRAAANNVQSDAGGNGAGVANNADGGAGPPRCARKP